MPRPENVTNEDIARWSEIIDNDPLITPILASTAIIREVLYAGQWLVDRLDEVNCPDHIIGRILYTAGALSFGRKDPWEVHQEILQQFKNGSLIFEPEPDNLN